MEAATETWRAGGVLNGCPEANRPTLNTTVSPGDAGLVRETSWREKSLKTAEVTLAVPVESPFAIAVMVAVPGTPAFSWASACDFPAGTVTCGATLMISGSDEKRLTIVAALAGEGL